MKINEYGICIRTEQELIDDLYANPDCENICKAICEDASKELYNFAARKYYTGKIADYEINVGDKTPLEFHESNQSMWLMPDEYKCFDIHHFLLESCKNEEEIDRIAYEIGVYESRGLIPLLRYIKYFVDTMRANNLVWGVGRGSASASYVLFKIGIHKVDSLKYGLDAAEFFKE